MKKLLFMFLFTMSLTYLFRFTSVILKTCDLTDVTSVAGYMISLICCFITASLWIKAEMKKQTGGAENE